MFLYFFVVFLFVKYISCNQLADETKSFIKLYVTKKPKVSKNFLTEKLSSYDNFKENKERVLECFKLTKRYMSIDRSSLKKVTREVAQEYMIRYDDTLRLIFYNFLNTCASKPEAEYRLARSNNNYDLLFSRSIITPLTMSNIHLKALDSLYQDLVSSYSTKSTYQRLFWGALVSCAFMILVHKHISKKLKDS